MSHERNGTLGVCRLAQGRTNILPVALKAGLNWDSWGDPAANSHRAGHRSSHWDPVQCTPGNQTPNPALTCEPVTPGVPNTNQVARTEVGRPLNTHHRQIHAAETRKRAPPPTRKCVQQLHTSSSRQESERYRECEPVGVPFPPCASAGGRLGSRSGALWSLGAWRRLGRLLVLG